MPHATRATRGIWHCRVNRARPSLVAVALIGMTGCGGSPSHSLSGTASESPSTASTASSQAPTPSVTGGARTSPIPPRPAIVRMLIPFGTQRKSEMAAYAQRHYGLNTYRLHDPQVIVEHFTDNDSVQATYDTFAPDIPDVELHELPGVCSHFVIGRDGEIAQFVPVQTMCRHTVGLNWTAIGIENVGFSDHQILADRRQLRASLLLTAWLRCRYHMKLSNVIGHNESLSSPFHHEDVASLRTQTHQDWNRTHMTIYRTRLARYPC